MMQIKDLNVLYSNEQNKILVEFNNTATDYPRDKCVHQLFEKQVEKTPDKIAVIFQNKALTYLELNQLIQEYADKLVSIDIKEKDVIAIHLERSYKLIAFQLAVLKIGAIFLPVDKRYPIERVEYMCSDCNVKILISDEINADSINATVITLNVLEKINPDKSAVTVNNSDVCYIIYTSGSTGNPKGCMLTGNGLLNFCKNNNTLETLNKHSNNVFACVNSVSFDYFIAESLLPLTNGYTTVILDDDEGTVQEKFLNAVKKNNINVVMTTPTRLKIYFDENCNCQPLQQLTCICTSGEPLTPELLTQMYTKAPNAQIYNPIGPSECSVWDIGGKLNKNDGIDIHIGKPIANTQIYIVDKYMKPAPIGVTGELCIAGDGVGAGYLNRPELTAEKFIDNPFGKGKLYKTGDLAYWREDGNIVYVGRNDFQVKIRGLRIELGEIENAICSIDGISQAVVVVLKNNEGRQLICAFYTGLVVDAKEIRNHIGKKLPKYMLPHIFTHLDEMPLTSSGKINRKALPEIDLEHFLNDTEYVAPENEQQKELCKLIESVLGTTPIGITDDFFDLGGDSLKAIEFVSKAHNEGIHFNLQNVFDYPTVETLCECIENGDKPTVSFADVDFSTVNTILAKNTVEQMNKPAKVDVGNILLAGATGYLGIHILADFLDNDNGTAYCLVRGKDKADSVKRLKELLEFYFGDKYDAINRIEVICADLQKDKFGLSDEKYTDLLGKVDTVINCAASVKHYGSYKYFYEANVETTKRLIAFCKEANAKLIHTSTLSVSGNTFGDAFDGYISETEKHFYESSLYIEQPLENVYGRSKFEAEKAVLDAMCDGLQANIMRMGNLTNRISDGQFQKNHESNAFLQRVKGVLELGLFPDYLIKDTNYSEFTPIDEAANAVMTIARHFSTEQTVFHINSIKVVYFDKLVEIINQLGYDLKLVNGTVFTEALRQTAKQTGMEHIFETFINDMDENDQLNYDSNIRIENDFTVEYLKKLGFEWSDIGIDYLRKYVEYFKKIGYLK
ncbi:MAG: amino acid adenylation domain-containing protein [Clostridia bacterium]|nr:amino acid adenylation domain-containing protein [Clostridia bacterium]